MIMRSLPTTTHLSLQTFLSIVFVSDSVIILIRIVGGNSLFGNDPQLASQALSLLIV